LVEVLTRWENSGGHWEVLSMTDSWVEIGLLTCGGSEQMSHVSGARTSVLRTFLRDRTSSAD